MRLHSVGLALRIEKARNCRKNHAYFESILNSIIVKWAQGKRYRLVKKLNPVHSIFLSRG